ncbi:B-block binding subunit of TFIIIC [Nakaseomyces glabratus]
MVLYPDELVSQLCEEIAYEKGAVSLAQLWNIAERVMGVTALDDDEPMQRYILQSLFSDPEVLVMDGEGNSVTKSVTEIDSACVVSISEEKLWQVLTGGYSKKDSSIGNSAFQLLVEIAHARGQGINTMELAQITKQDPRSITGRLKKLDNLIKSVQVIHNGHVVKNLRLRKFITDINEEENEEVYISMRDHLAEIVDVVKNSKNCIRQVSDLKRQLQFDKTKRLSRAFISAIAWLDENGYLRKVIVVSPVNPDVKIRCVKFLKDYKPSQDANEFSDSDMGEMSNDEDEAENDDEEAIERLNSTSTTDVLQGQELVLQEPSNTTSTTNGNNNIYMNRFYPIQNQTYAMVEKTGVKGLPTMDIINSLTGRDYKRPFGKISDYYMVSKNSKSKGANFKKNNKYQLTRLYDFEGKKKFYRFFTKENFEKLTDTTVGNAEVKNYNWPSDLKKQNQNIYQLSKKLFSPLNVTLRTTLDNSGKRIFFWNGELDIERPEIPSGSKKRKITVSEGERKSKSAQEKRSRNISDNLVEKDVEGTKLPLLNIDGFSASSLRSLSRQKAIMKVLEKSGGVSLLREQFFEDVTNYMSSSTVIDKKTLKGDVDLMIGNSKLTLYTDPDTQRKVIHFPDVPMAKISDLLTDTKDNKKNFFKDILHDTDIYFYDQNAKDRFNRKMKATERIRKYQNGRKNNNSEVRNTNSSSVKLFEERKRSRKERIDRTKKHNGNITPIVEDKQLEKASRDFNISTKLGIAKLIKLVVISKSIKNEVVWSQITTLFPYNSIDNLKRQWTARRIKMGQHGWKALLSKWRKILLQGISEELVTLEQTENLELSILLRLWEDKEKEVDSERVKLLYNYQENLKQLTFLKKGDNKTVSTHSSIAMSSMIQREIASLKHTPTLSHECSPDVEQKARRQDQIRTIVRSILVESKEMNKNEIDILKDVPRDELDAIIMDMAKQKQLYLHSSKLKPTERIFELLQTKGDFSAFKKAANLSEKIAQMLNSSYGIVINEEFEDVCSWIFIDLIDTGDACISIMPLERHVRPLKYTTRSFEIKTLTPPLVLYNGNGSTGINFDVKQIPVPLGKPFSKLWIDSEGSLRSDIWKSLLTIVLTDILFKPGVQSTTIASDCESLIGVEEIEVICQWLINKNLIVKDDNDGFTVQSRWYNLLKV